MKRLLAVMFALILILSAVPSVYADKTIDTGIRYEETYVPKFLQGLKMNLSNPDSLVLKDVGVIYMTIHERPYNFFAIQYEAQDEQGEIFEDWLYCIYTTEETTESGTVQGALWSTRTVPYPLIIARNGQPTDENYDMVYNDIIELGRYYVANTETIRAHEAWHTLSTKGLFY